MSLSSNKLLIVGWDGATWDYVDPMLKAGELPSLAGLLQAGARATLRSTVPPFTNIAWPALVTGRRPDHTGVYDGARTRTGSYERIPTNLVGYRGTPIWHWLNRFDRRTGVLNVPMTYPATPLDGYLISGFDSPKEAPDVASSPTFLEGWAQAGHPYTILHKEIALMDTQNPHQERSDLEAFVGGWEALTEDQGEFVAWVWEHDPVDVLFVVFSGTDSINHRTRDMAQIRRIYRATDRALGRLLETVDDDTSVCLVSDHGSTPAYRYVALYRILYDAGWLAFNPWIAARHLGWLPAQLRSRAQQAWERLPERARRLLSWPLLKVEPRLCEAYDNVDWERTTLYARSGMGPLYLNLQGREPVGTVGPEEYETLRAAVVDHLLDLRDPDGEPLFARVMRHEEVYPDTDPGDEPPDLIFEPARWSDHVITGYTTDPVVREIPDEREYGTHTPDGIFVLAGPNVAAGSTLDTADITDVVPTLLAHLEIPIPVSVDGKPLYEAFVTPPAVEHIDVEETTSTPASQVRKSPEVLGRLRALGYLE